MARRLILQILDDVLKFIEENHERTPLAGTLHCIQGLDYGRRLNFRPGLNFHQSTNIDAQVSDESERVSQRSRQMFGEHSMFIEGGRQTQEQAINEVIDR